VVSEWSEETADEAAGGALPRSVLLHPVFLAVLALALFSLSFSVFVVVSGDGTSEDDANANGRPAATEDVEDVEEVASDAAAPSDEQEAAAEETDGASEPPASRRPQGAFVEATLDLDAGPSPGLFRLSGRVPNEELATALLGAAELSYAPFVESDLEVDDSLEPAPWLEVSPLVIGLLPSVTDGTIRVVDGGIELAARSPNPQYVAQLEAVLGSVSGLPVEVVDQTITDLVPPAFYVSVDGGAAALSGYVPSEGIRQLLEGGAIAAYGPDNVTSELTIDEGTYTSFWMYTMPGVFQLFAPFSRYDLQVVDGVTSGSLQGGVNFAVDSTRITEEAAQVLDIGAAVLARDLSIFMTVEGHTDASGPDDYNQALSEARAESVVAYLVAAGISPDRLLAIGAGESEPVTSNDTDEGMALNRRVEFLFGPPPSG
jgi:outer membrane protein OmpA-like peptidoglycan-associated protein